MPAFGEKTGSGGGELGWDFSKDGATGTGAAQADVSVTKLEGASEDRDYYLRLDGGNWMRLEAFELNLEAQRSSIGEDKFAVSGLKLSDFSVQVGSSTELLKLTQALLESDNVKLEIEAYTAAKGALLVDEFRFEGVQLTGLQSANTVDNDFTLQLSGKYSHAHADAGKANLDTEFGWDFGQDQSFTGPAASGTLDPDKVTASVELSNPLEYYVHFSGAGFGDSWQRLESFSVGVTTLEVSSGGDKFAQFMAQPGGATLVLGSSGAVPLLEAALAEGDVLKIEVEAIRAGSLGTKSILQDQYVFEGVQLTGLELGQRAGDSDHVLSFDFDE